MTGSPYLPPLRERRGDIPLLVGDVAGARRAALTHEAVLRETLGWSYEQVKRFPEAIASLRKAVELSGGLPFTQASLGHVLAASNNRPAAEELLARLSRERQRQYVSPYDLAVVNAGLGNRERAIELLLEAETDRSTQLIHLGWDPRLAVLKEDPRFIRLLGDLGLGVWLDRGPVPETRIED